MPNCFLRRFQVPPSHVAFGPLCGPTDDHPNCASVVWHQWCRRRWLRDLEMWAWELQL